MTNEREILTRISEQVAADRRRPAFVRPMNVDQAEYEEQIRGLAAVSASLLERVEALEASATSPVEDDGRADIVTRGKKRQ